MNVSNAQQLVIRRRWSGFGDCEIKIAPQELSLSGSQSRMAARLARLLSTMGLGSLRFSVDPEWIPADGSPLDGPINDPTLTRFLRKNGSSLAQEWISYQRRLLPQTPGAEPVLVSSQPAFAAIPGSVKLDIPKTGLPSWFTSYCTPRTAEKSVPRRRRAIAGDDNAIETISESPVHPAAEQQGEPQQRMSA